MIVHFCKTSGWFAWLTRACTFSQWSHVAIEVDGVIYDATGKWGVKKWSKSEFFGRIENYESVEVSGYNQLAVCFLEEQLGKSYDYGAIIALPFREYWEHPKKWFCSELVAAALRVSAAKVFRLPSHRVTPRDLWVAL